MTKRRQSRRASKDPFADINKLTIEGGRTLIGLAVGTTLIREAKKLRE